VLAELDRIVRGTPQDYGWPRPTWTRELLVATLRQRTGVRVHVATMSRALIRARRARPRPTVGCPWAARRKNRRLRAIRKLLATLPRGQVAAYADEVDVHLNPKIGIVFPVVSIRCEGIACDIVDDITSVPNGDKLPLFRNESCFRCLCHLCHVYSP
jgi:hypothetical protein